MPGEAVAVLSAVQRSTEAKRTPKDADPVVSVREPRGNAQNTTPLVCLLHIRVLLRTILQAFHCYECFNRGDSSPVGIRLVCVLLLLAIVFPEARSSEHPLLVGVRLAETQYRNWRYGHRAHRRQVNCVQFMVAVVGELLGRELSPDERSAIMISNVRRRQLERLVSCDDKRIRGIQTALLQMNKGEAVRAEDARPGDFIQFWKRYNGRWRGHASIIVDVIEREGLRCAVVFGAHRTLNGVGIGEFEVGLNDPEIKSYIVRFKK